MKTSIVFCKVIICGIFLVNPLMGQEMRLQDVAVEITTLASANDLMDERLLNKREQLKSESDRVFPELVKLIHNASDDRVVNMALSVAKAASSKRQNEIFELARHVLTNRSSALYSTAIQTALSTLGESGVREDADLVLRFAQDQNILIATAAKRALDELSKSPESKQRLPDQRIDLPPNASRQPHSYLQPSPSVPTATPTASPPTMPVAATPAVTVEKSALVWPWLVGIFFLTVIVAIAMKRRP